MYLYAGSVSPLLDKSGEEIASMLENASGYSVKENERLSWENSLPELINILKEAGLSNLDIILEYSLPFNNKRVDAILVGISKRTKLPVALLVELKQWTTVKPTEGKEISTVIMVQEQFEEQREHPLAQVLTYKKYLEMNHSIVRKENITIEACAFLHNLLDEHILISGKYEVGKYKRDNILFCARNKEEFRDYLCSLFESENNKSDYKLITDGEYIPDNDLFENYAKYKNGEHLLTMVEEQQNVYMEACKIIREVINFKNYSQKHSVIIIQGTPGSGKTAVGLELFAWYHTQAKKYNWSLESVSISSPSRAICHVIGGYLGDDNGKSNSINSKNLFPNTYNVVTHLKNDNTVTCLSIVDEAHRITNENNIIELIKRSKVTIFLLDENQIIGPSEKGTLDNINKCIHIINSKGKITVEKKVMKKLKTQHRCGYNQDYLEKLYKLFEGGDSFASQEAKNKYDIKVCDTPFEMEKLLQDKRKHTGIRTRIVAGFCWPWTDPDKSKKLIDDIVIETPLGIWKKPWNKNPRVFPERNVIYEWYSNMDPLFDEVGCVYTVQGFDFEYVGVIFGDDFYWDGQKWCFDINNSQDKGFIAKLYGIEQERLRYDQQRKQWLVTKEADELVSLVQNYSPKRNNKDILMLFSNIYRILLTRGRKGCYVWFKDIKTREYFKSYFL